MAHPVDVVYKMTRAEAEEYVAELKADDPNDDITVERAMELEWTSQEWVN